MKVIFTDSNLSNSRLTPWRVGDTVEGVGDTVGRVDDSVGVVGSSEVGVVIILIILQIRSPKVLMVGVAHSSAVMQVLLARWSVVTL